MKKTLILLAALAFATAGTSYAQTTPAAAGTSKMKVKADKGPRKDKPKLSPEQKADHGAAKLAKELGLAPDQEARIEKILLARNQEMKGLKEKAGTDRKAAHEQMKTVRDKYDNELKGAMTAEQFAKYQQLRAEHKGHGGHRGHGPQDGKVKVKSKG